MDPSPCFLGSLKYESMHSVWIFWTQTDLAVWRSLHAYMVLDLTVYTPWTISTIYSYTCERMLILARSLSPLYVYLHYGFYPALESGHALTSCDIQTSTLTAPLWSDYIYVAAHSASAYIQSPKPPNGQAYAHSTISNTRLLLYLQLVRVSLDL